MNNEVNGDGSLFWHRDEMNEIRGEWNGNWNIASFMGKGRRNKEMKDRNDKKMIP